VSGRPAARSTASTTVMFSIASSGAVFTKLAAAANHPLPKPRHRPRPTDPLRDHRRRHLGIRRQQRPNPRLSHADRRLHRRPPILRWPIAGQCSPTVSRATPSCLAIARCDSLSLRCRCRINAQSSKDHPSNLIGWPTFQPVTTGLVFNRRQHEVSVWIDTSITMFWSPETRSEYHEHAQLP
jgi:hypothetical protein